MYIYIYNIYMYILKNLSKIDKSLRTLLTHPSSSSSVVWFQIPFDHFKTEI